MKKNITIEGMSCGHCTNSVEKALLAVPGVKNVAVDLAAKTAIVQADDSVSEGVLKKAVTEIGFKVTAIQ